jgi:hypothetical protein
MLEHVIVVENKERTWLGEVTWYLYLITDFGRARLVGPERVADSRGHEEALCIHVHP